MSDRFVQPVMGEVYDSEYDFPSDELADLNLRSPSPVSVGNKISLNTAGTLYIADSGEGFVFYGFNDADGSKAPEAFCQVCPSQNNNGDPAVTFPGKTGRGFRGSFTGLFLNWPSQVGVSMHFYIFKSRKYPWTGGQESI